jgi:membrane-associated phospholipid phosphatase
MTGAATRWGTSHALIGSTLSHDVNPLAAFPSLHVALPASQKGPFRIWAVGISVAVVMLGEHWVIDVAAGWALALASRWAVQRWWTEAQVAEPVEPADVRDVPEGQPAAAA